MLPLIDPSPDTKPFASTDDDHNANVVDALGWLMISAILLMSVRVGRLSGDGLVQTHNYLAHTWQLNPNHLLYEPLGATWLNLIGRLSLARPAVDQMLLLSVAAGAVTLGIFRRFVACNATTRNGANAATAWVAFSAAFMGLWLSSEAQMVQMPWLVLSYAAALAYATRPTTTRAVITGLAIGVATLFYISNGFIAVSIPVILAVGARYTGVRYQARQLATILAVAILVAAVGFVVAWLGTAAGTMSFAAWLMSYGGGHGSSRIVATYGIHGVAELPTAVARAIYGTALGVVNISGAVADIRTQGTITAMSLGAVVVCVGVLGLLAYGMVHTAVGDDRNPSMLLIAIAWVAAVFAFGVFWNNSDDQFYFQMSIALGAIVAASWTGRTRMTVALATVALVAWNGFATWRDLIAYPRDEYVAGLTTDVAGAGLVIFPGSDEIMQLMYFVPTAKGEKRINLISVAGTAPESIGLSTVARDVDCALSNGQRVVMLDVAVTGAGDSWRALALLGYPRDRVMATLDRYAFIDPRRVGPFVAHTLVPKPGVHPECAIVAPGIAQRPLSRAAEVGQITTPARRFAMSL